MLYRVRVGRDDYLGTAEEVVSFMARAEGAPGWDLRSYMVGVSARVSERLGVAGIATESPESFLETLEQKGVLRLERRPEPSDERVDPDEALGDGPVSLGPGVRADDLDL